MVKHRTVVVYDDETEEYSLEEYNDGVPPPERPTKQMIVVDGPLNVRSIPAGEDIGDLAEGAIIDVFADFRILVEGFYWLQLSGGEFHEMFAAEKTAAGGDVFLLDYSPNPDPPPSGGFEGPRGGRFTIADRDGTPAIHTANYPRPTIPIIGANVRNLVHVADPGTTCSATGIPDVIDHLGVRVGEYNTQNVKATIVRMYLAHEQKSLDQIKRDFERTLNIFENSRPPDRNNVFALPVFTDSIGLSNLIISGDRQYHRGPLQHLTHNWYGGAYRQNYLPFVRAIVEEFKDHPALFGWELMNEPGLYWEGNQLPIRDAEFSAFYMWAHETSEAIWELDQKHFILPGWLGAVTFTPAGKSREVYLAEILDHCPHLHGHTFHCHQKSGQDRYEMWPEEAPIYSEITIAHSMGRISFGGEVGPFTNRPTVTDDSAHALQQFFSRTAPTRPSAYLVWDFWPQANCTVPYLPSMVDDNGLTPARGLAPYDMSIEMMRQHFVNFGHRY